MIQAVRGFKDIYDRDVLLFQKAEAVLREVFKNWHFREVRTPVLERTELFQRGIGDDTDIVEKEMYTFPDRNGESLTMRPEGTASVVRFLNEHRLYGQERYLKFYYLGPMFRYERPQKGRLRQFHQAGIEIFGIASPVAELEGISLIWEIFKRLNISEVKLFINSLGCPNCRPSYKETLFRFLEDKKEGLCEDCKRRKDKNPLRLLDCKSEKCQENLINVPIITDFLCQDCRDHFDELKYYLSLDNIPFEINPRIVRGLDYYVRTVFEIHSELLGAQSALCAGGRYDSLSKNLGGQDLPAFGWAIGLERLISLLENRVTVDMILDFFVAIIGQGSKETGLKIVNTLRKNNYSTEYDPFFGSLKSQLRRADKLNAIKTIIIGEEEIKNNRIIIKDMKTGQEETAEINKFLKGEIIKWSF